MSQVVVITGGTSGIGLSMAEAFARRGDSVVVCGRSTAGLDRVSRALPEVTAIRADVTVADDRRALLDEVAGRFGRIDVLVNNAGTFVDRDFTSGAAHATDDLDAEVALNLTAPVHLTGEVLQRWRSPRAIVFVTSGFAFVSPTRAPTYGAVKAGLHAFADGLRRQLAPVGTHVLEVVPPTTDTPMNADRSGAMLSPSDVAAATLDALGRRGARALPGKSRMIPPLQRLAPRTLERMVAGM